MQFAVRRWVLLWGLQLAIHQWSISLVESCSTSPSSTTPSWPPTAVRGGEDPEPSPAKSSRAITVHSVVAVFHLSGDDNDDDENNDRPMEESPVSWLVGEDATPYSAVMMGREKKPIYRMPRLPHGAIMMSTLGILSDTIVIVLPSDTMQSLHLLNIVSERLLKIANFAPGPIFPRKKSLVIVSESANESWWVEEVAQNRLRSITPSLWETFDVLTPQAFQSQWQQEQMQMQTGGNIEESVVGTLIPYEDNAPVYAELVQQVYRHLSSKEGCSPLIEIGHDSLDNVPTTPVSTTITGEPTTARAKAATVNHRKSLLKEDVDPQDRIRTILQDAQAKLADLESKLQAVQLESSLVLSTTNNNQAMPLLDFGGAATDILEGAYRELEQFPENVRIGFMNRLVLEVHELYKDQLQSLRDYYGRRYELSLDQEEESVWAAEAEHMTEGFQTAAKHAVPSICQGEGPLAKIITFDSLNAMHGLVQDMLEAMYLRKDEQSLAVDEDELDGLSSGKHRRVPPWVKKVASRAIALGINYLQGWLAWQGIKRAALERDREMPKFPLF